MGETIDHDDTEPETGKQKVEGAKAEVDPSLAYLRSTAWLRRRSRLRIKRVVDPASISRQPLDDRPFAMIDSSRSGNPSTIAEQNELIRGF